MSDAHDALIGTVPSRLLETAQFIVTPYDGHVTEFNVAVWLRVPGLAGLPVSLRVVYRDGSKRHALQVDHGNVSSTERIMLSGVARMSIRFKLEEMEIHLSSAIPARSLVVEELYVQAAEVAGDASQHGSA